MVLFAEQLGATPFQVGLAYSFVFVLTPLQIVSTALLPRYGFKALMLGGWRTRSFFLGVPAVNIGSRQQGRERGKNVIDVDHDRKAIAGAIAEHRRRGKSPCDRLYGDGKAGPRIAETLANAELRVEKRLTY